MPWRMLHILDFLQHVLTIEPPFMCEYRWFKTSLCLCVTTCLWKPFHAFVTSWCRGRCRYIFSVYILAFFPSFIYEHKFQQSYEIVTFSHCTDDCELIRKSYFPTTKLLSSFVKEPSCLQCAGAVSGLRAESRFLITSYSVFFHSTCNQRLVYLKGFLTQLSNQQFQCVYAIHNLVLIFFADDLEDSCVRVARHM